VFIDPMPLLPLVIVWFSRVFCAETLIVFCMLCGFETAIYVDGMVCVSGW
jgi:hypothetical protein